MKTVPLQISVISKQKLQVELTSKKNVYLSIYILHVLLLHFYIFFDLLSRSFTIAKNVILKALKNRYQ